MNWKAFLLATCVMVGGSAAHAQVQFDGDVRFSMIGQRLSVYIEELENFSATATDKLRVRVWASENRWPEAGRPHLLGSDSLPRVGANRDRDHVRETMKLRRPDTDWYYVTIVLEERTVDTAGQVTWVVRDWRDTDDRIFIRDTWFPLIPWD